VEKPDTSSKDRKDNLDKQLDGQELTAVLAHYAAGSSAKPQTNADGDAVEQKDLGGDEADALYCLGHCFERGLHECGEDKAKAALYYRMAAAKGSPVAQWRLGHLHEYGEGVAQDVVLAADWYRQAAEAGHAQAQSSFALLLEDGQAGEKDDAQALRWHLEAAAQGQSLSLYCAACCLAEGRGTKRDEVSAKTFLEKSAAKGFPPAVEALAQGHDWFREQALSGDRANEPDYDEVLDAEKLGSEDSLLDIATRVAKQIGHLSDADADQFLDQLLGSLDDDTGLEGVTDELQELLAWSPPAWTPPPELLAWSRTPEPPAWLRMEPFDEEVIASHRECFARKCCSS